jgi:hypothetical protein
MTASPRSSPRSSPSTRRDGAAYAHAGKMDEAKAERAEARRVNPATIKWMKEHSPNLPAVFDGLRKVGLPED